MVDTARIRLQATPAGRRQNGTWRTFDATDGLAAGVWALLQDARGYLWLGTRAGLCRYDGTEFVTYTRVDGLCGDEVMALAEVDGRLWIGTRTGLSSFDGRRFTSYTTADGLPHDEIEDLYVDRQGRLWLATHGGVACREGDGFRVLTTADGLLSDDVRRVYQDRNGTMWYGTVGGLSRHDRSGFVHYTRHDGLPSDHVLAVHEDAFGSLWVGTLVGVARYDGDFFEPFDLDAEGGLANVRAIHEDRHGHLWFGSIGQGLLRYDGASVLSYGIREGLLGEHVTCMGEDAEGHLWFGDGLSGLTCYHADTVEYLTDEPVTEAVCQDDAGRLWFASGNTLCCLDRGDLHRQRFGVRIFGLLLDRQQRLWVATWGEGLRRYDTLDAFLDDEGETFTVDDGLCSNTIAGLLLDRHGRVWAGCAYPGGLCRYDGPGFHIVEMPQKVVFRILEDSAGAIWTVGFSSGGLARYDGQAIRHWDAADGLPSDAVQSIVQDHQGQFWLGTRQGLSRFDGERFTFFGKEHGFLTLDNQISVCDGGGQLWFGTKCGVYRWSGEHLQVLTRDDGLPGNSVTSLVPEPDGAVIIGTYHGVVRYRPTAVRPPLIEVREVVADQVFSSPEQVTLTASGAALVTFAFRGLSLGTHRMRYSYCLEGYDEGWQDTWETHVRYEQLPVGRYTFKVIAINRDLVPSETPAEVALKVIVDPWREQQREYEAELDRMQQLLEVHQRSTRQNHALVELARNEELSRGDLSAALRMLARTAAGVLGCDHVAVWRFDPPGYLSCLLRYARADDTCGEAEPMAAALLADYLKALEEGRSLAVDDVGTDPRTAEWRECYEPWRVGAALDAPVRIGGRMAALLSHQQGEPRHWALDEQQFVASLADLASLAIEAHERREAEARVRYQANLLEEVSDAIVAVDLEHHVTSWNRGAEAMYGWQANEAIGRPIDEVINVGPDQLAWRELWRRVAAAAVWHGEAAHCTRDGRELNVEWSLSSIRDSGGRPIGAVAVIHDCTQRKRAEEERRRLEMQIQHAQKLESLGVLAGGIAHDFNNLLMGVLGNAGLAQIELPPESPARQSVAQIELAAQRAAELTRQMLAYSGRGHLEVRSLNLSKLVKEMAHLLEVSISKKAVLTYAFAPTLPTIQGDATQIRQVVMNLITNASDAIGDQNGVISLSTGHCHVDRAYLAATYVDDALPEGDYAYVEVTDTGCGMDEATRGRIFEPFFTTKFTGRGLGLAAVLGIVRGHHGAIRVTSEPGRGTTFQVLLPATAELEEEAARQAEADSNWRGSGTILVVDDEEAVRAVVGRSLEQLGFEVLLAADGVEAVEVFTQHQAAVTLVVLDMTMPRMDGQEAFRALRQLRPDVRVILSSGYNEQEAVDRFAGEGLAGFLQKPYGPRRLMEKVREVLAGEVV